MKTKIEPLEVIVSEQLSSVIFVQDYLQLDFDGSKLTCNIWPIVNVDGSIFNFGQSEYRNALCKIISKKVSEIIFDNNDQRVSIIFQDGNYLSFNLNDADPKIGNAMILDDVNGNWSIY